MAGDGENGEENSRGEDQAGATRAARTDESKGLQPFELFLIYSYGRVAGSAGSDATIMVLDQPRISLQPTLQRIAQFAELDSNWDSYGAAPPTAKALLGAARLATRMAEVYASVAGERALPWAVAPLANGGMQLEWRGANGALEIEIDADGGQGYLLELGQGHDLTYQEGDNVTDDDLERLLAVAFGIPVG